MGRVLYGSARTTAAERRAVQHSQASLNRLAAHYGINAKAVAKWSKRTFLRALVTAVPYTIHTVLTD
jgi:hypothetical protein